MPEVNHSADRLYHLVEKLGNDFSLVQGLGGNVSFKSRGILYVKASGMRFGNVRDSGYFYRCSLRGENFDDDIPGQSGKPSIEAFLHALLPHTYVVHLHSHNAVAASMVTAPGMLVPDEIINQKVQVIPYARPGRELCDSIKSKVLRHDTEVLLLKNHGVVYFSDDIDSLDSLISRWEQVWRNLRETKSLRAFSPNDIGSELTADEHSHVVWQAENNWRVSPDHVVFLGATPDEFLQEFMSSRLILGKQKKQDFDAQTLTVRDEQIIWFVNLALSLPKRVLSTLSLDEALWLRNWDSEKHRVQLAERMFGNN